VLDRAVDVLKEFDTSASRSAATPTAPARVEYNRDLSRRRADAVKRYLVEARRRGGPHRDPRRRPRRADRHQQDRRRPRQEPPHRVHDPPEAAAAAAAEPEPEPEPEAKAGAKVKTAAKPKGTDAAAKAVYTAKCKSCHGDDGQGKTKFAEKNKIQDISKNKDSVTKIAAAIRDGVDGTKMKPFKDKLSEDEIKAVAAYVKTL
jgi:mono/diheme cytochrome c family protein